MAILFGRVVAVLVAISRRMRAMCPEDVQCVGKSPPSILVNYLGRLEMSGGFENNKEWIDRYMRPSAAEDMNELRLITERFFISPRVCRTVGFD